MGKLVADIIVETLQSAGVKHCYGVVGDTLNFIARSLEKSEIEWVSVRHEEAGAFAAQAEAQVADRLTAVAGSCGPGSLHFINGIYEANRNRAPVILIASQIIRDWASISPFSGRTCGAVSRSSWTSRHCSICRSDRRCP